MIILILLAGLILRLISLGQSLWLDEAINVIYSQKFDFLSFLTVYSLGDFHPPLYFGILWVWTRVFGLSEISVRFPSVILGVLTIYLAYLTAKEIFNKKIALIAAVILALNPLHVYYSQEARMYSLAAFSVTLSFWSLINLLKHKKFFLVTYGFSVALVLYSDYVAYLALPAQFIFVIWQERKSLGKVLAGLFLGVIAWSPWLLIFPSQLKTGQNTASVLPGWANVVGGSNLKDLALVWVKALLGRISFENKIIYTALVLLLSSVYGVLIFRALRKFKKETVLFLCWFVIPFVLAFIISFYIPILAYFRLVFILPALAILLALGISSLKKWKLVLCAVLVFNFSFLLIYYLNPRFQREDWREAISFANKTQRIILFENIEVPAPAQYYNCDSKCLPGLKKMPAQTQDDLVLIPDGVAEIYLFNYLVEVTDPKRLREQQLINQGFKKGEVYNRFSNIGEIVYWYK